MWFSSRLWSLAARPFTVSFGNSIFKNKNLGTTIVEIENPQNIQVFTSHNRTIASCTAVDRRVCGTKVVDVSARPVTLNNNTTDAKKRPMLRGGQCCTYVLKKFLAPPRSKFAPSGSKEQYVVGK